MTMIKALIIAILGSLIGFGLGRTPVLNEHLDWTFFYVIPISGIVLGLVTGYVMSVICRILQVKLSFLVICILSAGAVLGMYLVNFGIFVSLGGTLDVAGAKEYMDYMAQLHDAEGAGADKWSYNANLIGAGVAAFLILLGLQDNDLYCDKCKKHLKRKQKAETFELEGSTQNLEEIVEGFSGAVSNKSVEEAEAKFGELRNKFLENPVANYAAQVQLSKEQYGCPKCSCKKCILKFNREGEDDWEEILDLRIVVEEV